MKERKSKNEVDEMLPEYDFSGKKGIRGKYYRAYRRGHSVRIHKVDGSVSVKYFTLEDGAVMLEPSSRNRRPASRRFANAFASVVAHEETSNSGVCATNIFPSLKACVVNSILI